MPSSARKAGLTFKSINFQNGKLFEELTGAVAALRKDGSYTTESIKAAEFTEIIRLYTNIDTKVMVDANVGLGAFIIWPMIDRNHPFVDAIFRPYVTSMVGISLIRALGDEIKGTVDLASCKVSGIFTKIPSSITIGLDLLKDNKISDGEIAAIILHEVGHFFTYCEYLGTVVYNAHVISAITREVMEIREPAERVKIFREAEQILGIEIKDDMKLVNMNEKGRAKAVQAMLISATAEKSRHETGFNVYELRSVEQLADQFATRHGAGRELATALDKLYRTSWSRSTMSSATHVMIEIVKLIFFTLGLALSPFSMIIYVLTTNPTNRRYDPPEARVKYIKQMIISELKQEGLSMERREQLEDDIKAVSRVEETLSDKTTLMELFWTTIMPSGRRATTQEQTMKLIEELINNDLFAIANNFRNLGE